jgi:hypothetical protein
MAGIGANHRRFLARLQRQKQLEREAAARREEASGRLHAQALEAGFQVCFNGANRTLADRPRPQTAAAASESEASPTASGPRRLVRTPGAVPLDPRRLGYARPMDLAAAAADRPRRERRQWDIGATIGVKVTEGEAKGEVLLLAALACS